VIGIRHTFILYLIMIVHRHRYPVCKLLSIIVSDLLNFGLR